MTALLETVFAKGTPTLSTATLSHAFLKFSGAIRELTQTTDALERSPTFSLAVDACMTTRTAWLKAFPEWRLCGDEIRHELLIMQSDLQRILPAFTKLSGTKLPPLHKEKLDRFYKNVAWRLRMVDVLLNESIPSEDREKKVIEMELRPE